MSHNKRFRFVLTINESGFYDIFITSKTNSSEVNHEGSIILRCSGKKREDAKKSLINILPRDFHLSLVNNTNI